MASDTLARACQKAIDAYQPDDDEQREEIIEAVDAAVFEVVADIHSILYPEKWPRERQPDHMYWNTGYEPDGVFEWPGGNQPAEWVGEALWDLVQQLRERERVRQEGMPFDPDWVIHPGATLQDWMDENNETLESLAQKCSMNQERLQRILDGRPLGVVSAAKLAQGTRIPARMWLDMERLFRAGLLGGKHWSR